MPEIVLPTSNFDPHLRRVKILQNQGLSFEDAEKLAYLLYVESNTPLSDAEYQRKKELEDKLDKASKSKTSE